ncbi:MAG: patatin-like phospholipase family protein [Candidatus Marinimicrobia bacterium]|nr:patatin-like phospholipase family protein [Candidatus Neomarinimicrobiota bacterium]
MNIKNIIKESVLNPYYFILAFLIFSISFCNENPKIGLVLSGGGAKGFAHIGALKILDSLEIPIDYIVGTSIGAIAGAMYSVGFSGIEIEQMAHNTNWEAMFTDQVPRRNLPYFEKKDYGKYQLEFRLNKLKPVEPDGFIHGQSALLELNKIFSKQNKNMDFSQFKIPFKCIATDIITGNEVIIERGVLPKALRASLSIPTIFSPVIWGDSLLVDGGVINNLPTDIVKEMGADIIIAIDVGTPMKNKSQLNGFREIMEQTIGILEYKIEAKNSKLADLIIKPDLKNYKSSDFTNKKINGMVKKGLLATQKNIPELIKIKNELKFIEINNNLQIQKHVTIHEIKIFGLKTFSPTFINRLLGISINSKITIEKLNNKINNIYGLGYFKIIEYYFEENNNKTDLILKIIEQPENKLRFGIKWDHEHQIIITSNVQLSNIPFSGVRFENQFTFGGIRHNQLNIYYPSKTLNYPIYPFLRIIDSWQPITKYNNHGKKVATLDYYKQYLSIGFGTTIGNYWASEIDYKIGNSTLDSEFEITNIEDILYKHQYFDMASFEFVLDNLNDNLSPQRGVNISISGDYSLKFGKYSFHTINSFFDSYLPIKKHAIRNLIYINLVNGNKIPFEYYLINENEKFHAGIPRFGLFGEKLIGIRNEFIYQYKKDIFFHIFYNPIVFAQYKELKIQLKNAGGVMVSLKSPLGPINLTWSYSPNSLYLPTHFTTNFYFSAGYEF